MNLESILTRQLLIDALNSHVDALERRAKLLMSAATRSDTMTQAGEAKRYIEFLSNWGGKEGAA